MLLALGLPTSRAIPSPAFAAVPLTPVGAREEVRHASDCISEDSAARLVE